MTNTDSNVLARALDLVSEAHRQCGRYSFEADPAVASLHDRDTFWEAEHRCNIRDRCFLAVPLPHLSDLENGADVAHGGPSIVGFVRVARCGIASGLGLRRTWSFEVTETNKFIPHGLWGGVPPHGRPESSVRRRR